jgi:phosphoenolpyruvate phosphomutase
MIDVRGRSLLQRLVMTLSDSGIRDVTVVRGYCKEAVNLPGIKTVDNDRFAATGEVFSLAQASAALAGEVVVAYGDILFRNFILDSLLSSKADVVIAVDASGADDGQRRARDLVVADRPFTGNYLDDDPAHLLRIDTDHGGTPPCGEWVGLARFSATGAQWLREEVAALEADGLLETASMPLLLSRVAARHPVRVKYFTGHWMNVNTLGDLADARNFT